MESEALLRILQNELPYRLVRMFGGHIQVRKSAITLQSVEIVFNERRQSAKVRSMMDSLDVFMLLMLPVGLYIYFNKAKHVALKREVVEVLQRHRITIE